MPKRKTGQARRQKRVVPLSAYSQGQQLQLHYEEPLPPVQPDRAMQWPAQDRFPLNLKPDRNVQEFIVQDLRASANYLIVSGFTSLNHLVDFFGHEKVWADTRTVRLLLGWDPSFAKRKAWAPAEAGREVKDYWLGRGFWLDQGGAVFRFSEWLQQGRIRVKYARHQHAKLYVGDEYAILGSANFSKSGTTTQQEASERVPRPAQTPDDGEQPSYYAIRQIAENFYDLAADYDLDKLLAALFRLVRWPDALARAISALVDDTWYQDLPSLAARLDNLSLWPTQQSGLTQALNILQANHCVLVADPTGSGKTRMVTALQVALQHGLRAQGDETFYESLTVSPPTVLKSWEREKALLGVLGKDLSLGLLSQRTPGRALEREQLRHAGILVLDEAHNLLNPHSARSRQVAGHGADYVILATATPINRRAGDLLRILQLLDLDNLSDEHLRQYREIFNAYMRGGTDLSGQQHKQLKQFVGQFLVRRTKPLLRKLIEQAPDLYRNAKGQRCAYPEPQQLTYTTRETAADQYLAKQIEDLAGQLQGLLYLRQFKNPDPTLNLTPTQYVDQRVKMAPGLAKYMVQARLRSSRFALLEHILGTVAAAEEAGWTNCLVSHSGNVVGTLAAASTRLPTTTLPSTAFVNHTWLLDPVSYQAHCIAEIRVYEQIVELARQLSENREQAKAALLRELVTRSAKPHNVALAFDSTISTLHYLHWKYLRPYSDVRSHVVTGESDKTTILEKCSLEATTQRTIFLCSDALSEGVNLQRASAVVFLNMPGVVRLAEQRIGRVERLDSPYPTVEIYWPDDTAAFALKTDLRLFKAAHDTAALLGANFTPPTELLRTYPGHAQLQLIQAAQAIEELQRLREQENNAWEGLPDAFQPVHDLYVGEKRLIETSLYEQMRPQRAAVKVRLSWVPSTTPWLFVALNGRAGVPARWLWFDDSRRRPSTDLTAICRLLRRHLKGVPTDAGQAWDDEAQTLLEQYTQQLKRLSMALLPAKRQRAIAVGEALTMTQHKVTSVTEQALRVQLWRVRGLSNLTAHDNTGMVLDAYSLSQQWLLLLQPKLQALRAASRKKLFTLDDLRTAKPAVQFTAAELTRFESGLVQVECKPLDIAACILGVSNKNTSTTPIT